MSNLLGRVQKQREEAAEKSLATFKFSLAQTISDHKNQLSQAEDHLKNVGEAATKHLEEV